MIININFSNQGLISLPSVLSWVFFCLSKSTMSFMLSSDSTNPAHPPTPYFAQILVVLHGAVVCCFFTLFIYYSFFFFFAKVYRCHLSLAQTWTFTNMHFLAQHQIVIWWSVFTTTAHLELTLQGPEILLRDYLWDLDLRFTISALGQPLGY